MMIPKEVYDRACECVKYEDFNNLPNTLATRQGPVMGRVLYQLILEVEELKTEVNRLRKR